MESRRADSERAPVVEPSAMRAVVPAVARPTRALTGNLVVGAADAPAEIEADRLADQALRSGLVSLTSPSSSRVQRAAPDHGQHPGGAAVFAEHSDSPVDADTDRRIRRAIGGGQALPSEVRGPMEGAFGRSFGDVRVHHDGESQDLNTRIQARAFTIGSDVFLGEGERLAPTQTMAHELAHVAQQTGGVHRIRRLIGFEYEIDEVKTYKVKKASELAYATDFEPIAPGYNARADARLEKWLVMKKGEILAEQGDVEVTADETSSGSNLELRTKAIDDTNPATVTQTARELADVAGRSGGGLTAVGLQASTAHPPHLPRASELGMPTFSPTAFYKPPESSAPLKGKIQATTGIRLDRLPDLIRNAFVDGNESIGETGRRGEGRQALTGFDQTGQLPAGPILTVMGAAPTKATQALATYKLGHTDAPDPTSELTGLLSLLIAYMDMAKQGLVRSYSKTIAPVMARTDFATMFTMLGSAERNYYAGDKGKNFSALLVAAGYTVGELDQAIYSADITESQEPNEWYRDLSRKDWLEAIPSKAPKPGRKDKPGKDKLTPKHYPTRRGRKEIEGLGSYAAKTDTVDLGPTVPPLKVPIVELRSLPKMDPTQFVDFAEKLARLVAYLNAGQDKTYGET